MKPPKWLIALTAAATLALSACQDAKKELDKTSPSITQTELSPEERYNAWLKTEITYLEPRLKDIQNSIDDLRLLKGNKERSKNYLKHIKERIIIWSNEIERARIRIAQKEKPPSDKLAALQTAANNLLAQVNASLKELEKKE